MTGLPVWGLHCTNSRGVDKGPDRDKGGEERMRGLQERGFLVVGGATGIGAAVAERLALAKARLVIADINEAGMARTVDKLRGAGVEASAIRCDLADQASIEAMMRTSVERLGKLHGVASTVA